jgi:hypothetical protein
VKLAATLLFACVVLSAGLARADKGTPEILRISPTSGPEGSRVEIIGKNLQEVSTVLFGANSSTFKLISAERLIAIVPHRTATSTITVVTPQARVSSPFPFAVLSDPRIPEEVSYKAGYVNSIPAPPGFSSVELWGIAIADTRVSGYESATVEVGQTQLSCRADGREVVLNDDAGKLRGGLYRRDPWFAGNQSEPMPLSYDTAERTVILQVGRRADRVWHFWSASPRPALPPGKLEGCTVKALVRISAGALLQMGMDYWRNPTVPHAPGNNHEAGASNWYFPSEQWQEATFTDLGGPAF